ncbi:P-loop containing nucleoside triphosphate hydrolase protein [Lentinus tigrinus ALCF2SS1-7]|uniref:P-loop containing nucleoside triphosphate hydrolase protein n=1 Tax=Lentinus tigrinus ALCF2SS1-7 TaxID=1328758 RepID=UPI001165D645|nr:P-loop containing nucleoside triphosphate hydrolase protein [Lentinus tigrinus ALCF2SS1-7]
MAKRRAVADSDDERESEPHSKRSRTSESDDEQPGPHNRRSGKGKGRAPAQEDNHEPIDIEDDDDDGDAGMQPDEDEEKKFEEDHEEIIRERLMNKSKTQGGIAEMGIIESLEMHQFMCHKYLTFQLGPQINFIIGHNGSGKSAVLSALTVALGGKANSTGRGTGLKSFIREGQSVAEVTVVLKNQGEEAYRPKEYGKSIVITRRFTKDGASSYKIKNKDGKVISTKREELQAICDHMNIQVDNPMNILTQDSARQFLSASSPSDKYKFFLKGTQLSQLSEEYQTCMENISQTAKVLKRKAEVIPDLEDQYNEAQQRFEEAERAREQRHRADELKKELAWAHVAAKEQELEGKMKDVAAIQHKIERNEAEIKTAEDLRVACNANVVVLEEELEALGEVETLNQRQEEVKRKSNQNKSKMSQLRSEEKTINESLVGVNGTIAGLEKQISDEQARVESHSREKREKANAKLQETNAKLAEKDATLKNVVEERQHAFGEVESATAEIRRLELERGTLQERVMECEGQMARCAEMERSKFAQFGNNMDRVMHEIRHRQWYGQPPVGPFGLYVKIKEPEKWGNLLRIVIGGNMSSFALTDGRDRPALAKILEESGNRNCQIIIAEVDLFDFSEGEPPQGYLTILRALEVSDPYVLRQLVNSAHVESVLLAHTRAEADQMLMSLGTGGTAMAADNYRVVRFPEGGGQSNPIPPLRNGDNRQQLFRSSNADAERRRWAGQRDEYSSRLQASILRLQELKGTLSRAQKAVNDLQAKERQLGRECRELRTKISNLQVELNEDLPVNIQALQDALQEAMEEKANIMQQFEALAREKQKVADEGKPLSIENEQIRRQIAEFSERRQAIKDRLSDAVTERMQADHSIQHYRTKADAERDKLKAAEEAANDVQAEFEAWTKKASDYCERVHNPRKVEVVQRNLEAVQAALKEREKRQGASIEEIAEELQRKKAALDTAKKEIRALNSLNKALKKSVKARLARWHEFRRHIALRCKVYFGYHLSNRGYFGKVLFDHVNGKLELKVQTDDQNLTQANTREKDPRSLSGGEKSFSTICLLLSLWESIGCPIRCLDEFDVFMDAVNRRISMKMMIDTANTSNRKQYVLITPQDMTNINIGNTVRVHRMTDPERGQGVLAFS